MEMPRPSPTADNNPQTDWTFSLQPTPELMNIPYVTDGGAHQMLDVHLPANGDGPFPTILAIHGGGFRVLSKTLYRQIAGYLNDKGYALVATNYRLTPKHSYPAQVEDVFCALAWIHSNHSMYGFDNERAIVMGDSAGGYLAGMVGTVDTPSLYLENCPHTLPESDWIQGAVVFYGFYDFTSIYGYPAYDVREGLQPFLGAEYDQIPHETLVEMSPMSWVDGSEPSFLLNHGTEDMAVPWMSEDIAAVLEDAGVEVDLTLIEVDHGFILKSLSHHANVQSLEAIESFLAMLFQR
jgi:acetyl esterase/lipase